MDSTIITIKLALYNHILLKKTYYITNYYNNI